MKSKELIAIGLATPGMRLAESLVDGGGRVLVPAGAELTDRLLEALARRDVAELLVEREIAIDQEAREAMLAGIDQCLSRRFRQAGEGAETRLLYQAVRDYCLEQGV